MVFRGCTCVYCNLFAALLQTVSSCRGPIYRARIYVNAHEMEGGNACAVKWMCVFNNVNMFICLCKDTGAMNRPLRLAECFVVFRGWTWVYCGMFCGVSWVGVTLLVNRSQRCCRSSAALLQTVRSCRGPIYRARIYVNTHEMGRGNACAMMWIYVDRKSVV